MSPMLHLVSHHLCPYVQRAVIVAVEKEIAFERVFIDLSAKPDWFLSLSPTGKVPLLRVTDTTGTEHVLFESAAICEYLDETAPKPMLPEEPLERAKTRAWVEFASGTLADIAGLYAAPNDTVFATKRAALQRRFVRADAALVGPWFAGARFGLVDAAFGPVFRYLEAFETLADVHLMPDLMRLTGWRTALAARPSVVGAVTPDHAERLAGFLRQRHSHLSRVVLERASPSERPSP